MYDFIWVCDECEAVICHDKGNKPDECENCGGTNITGYKETPDGI